MDGIIIHPEGANIYLNLGNDFAFQGNFGTLNLTEEDQALINLKVERLNTSISFLNRFIPSFRPPENFYKLGKIDFNGRFDG